MSRRRERGGGRAAIAKRVSELLALVGLPDAGARYPAQLSGGQQQRVALARALATSPGLLLLDEPLSALDARVRLRLRHEIKALQRRLGVTTIMVTHDQEEALTMADRIVVMNQGAIEQVGSPQEIYRKPATAFVADFVGSMNFLAGTLEAPERVRIGSLTLACPPQDGLAAGTAVRLCIRPEDVRVRDLPDGRYQPCFRRGDRARFRRRLLPRHTQIGRHDAQRRFLLQPDPRSRRRARPQARCRLAGGSGEGVRRVSLALPAAKVRLSTRRPA